MAVNLTPWPPQTSAVARAAARACLRGEIGDSTIEDAVLDRLGETASALVERYASSAPQAVRDEAVVRVVGYLAQTPHTGLTRLSVDGIDLVFDRMNRSAMRLSGAKALLAPWRSPGAAIAEASE